MSETSKLWRETHRAEYLAYLREYNRTHPKEKRQANPNRRKYRKAEQEEKQYQSATAQEISDQMLKLIPWNPRILEHDANYDCPWREDPRRETQ